MTAVMYNIHKCICVCSENHIIKKTYFCIFNERIKEKTWKLRVANHVKGINYGPHTFIQSLSLQVRQKYISFPPKKKVKNKLK